MEQRLIELESKLAFAEDTLEALNHTVFRQQEKIDQLQEQLRLVYQQLQGVRQAAAEPTPRFDPLYEKPPHY